MGSTGDWRGCVAHLCYVALLWRQFCFERGESPQANSHADACADIAGYACAYRRPAPHSTATHTHARTGAGKDRRGDSKCSL